MLIFQANDKVLLSESTMEQWDKYLTKKCENDEAILLPPFIDFVCMVTDNSVFSVFPELVETVGEDGDDYEESGT